MKTKKALINLFHPNFELSRGNKAIFQELEKMKNVVIRNMYQLYPNWKIDIKAEQQFLLENDLIVFQHPMQWYSCPSLMKEWIDGVLERGFAYPPGSGDQLKAKQWWNVITTGGPQEAYQSGGYNGSTVSELFRPF